jgi:hypothetical protein
VKFYFIASNKFMRINFVCPLKVLISPDLLIPRKNSFIPKKDNFVPSKNLSEDVRSFLGMVNLSGDEKLGIKESFLGMKESFWGINKYRS